MGIFSFIFGKTETAAAHAGETRLLADPSAELLALLGGAVLAQSGASVGPATAMRSTAVPACVEAIAEAVGCLYPAVTYERGSGDSRTRAAGHAAYGLARGERVDAAHRASRTAHPRCAPARQRHRRHLARRTVCKHKRRRGALSPTIVGTGS